MQWFPRQFVAALMTALCGAAVLAQSPPAGPPTPVPAPKQEEVSPTAVAALVNNQPIYEATIQRALAGVLPDKRADARPELINFLIDNLVIEQYLVQQGLVVEQKDVDSRIDEMRKEAAKQKKDFDQMLKDLKLTMAELREHVTADIRWDKYSTSQATEKSLRELFDANKEMFDGTMVRARHILLTPAPGNAESAEQAPRQLLVYKKQIEDQVAAGLAKLPASADALTREQTRTKLMDEAFSAMAREKSACPSKKDGGDVSWFQRAGFMVEPFAKVAFSLKPFEISDVVKTQFGCHLILVTERKPGREVKFEDVKDDVKEVFCDRLRENLAGQLRARSKIVITPVKP
jgi:peptidyl-prolyl cis-trans isomerase C